MLVSRSCYALRSSKLGKNLCAYKLKLGGLCDTAMGNHILPSALVLPTSRREEKRSRLSRFLHALRKQAEALCFGVEELDQLVGGFCLGDFALIYGSCYANALAHLLCVRSQLSAREGGLESAALFVDGENCFNPYLAASYAQLLNLDPREALENIYVSRAFTAYQLSSLVTEKLPHALGDYGCRLVVVAGASTLFLDPAVPFGEAKDLFNKVVMKLKHLSTSKKAVVVATESTYRQTRRNLFTRSVLRGKSRVLLRVEENGSKLVAALEKHPSKRLSRAEVFLGLDANASRLDSFLEV